MAGILGLNGFNKSDGTNKLLAVAGTYVFELSGSAWVNKGSVLTANKNAEFANFLDYAFMVNGYDGDAMRSYDGTNWSISTLVNDAPKGNYIHLFGRRLCVGYVSYFNQTFPSRVWYSDIAKPDDTLVWGREDNTDLITTAGRSVVTSNSSKFMERGIKVGDTFVITSGTNQGTYAVSNVLSETQLDLVTGAPYAGTDQGVLATSSSQSFWCGSNYIDVKTDDGDVIEGLGDNSGRLLIFKRNSLHRWGGTGEAEEVKGSPGTPSHRSIVNLKNIPITMFLSANPVGIFAYDGVKSTNITRGIQDYLDGISAANLDTAVGWRVGDLYKVYVGTITNTDKDISIPNAVIVYNAAGDSLWFESLTHVPQVTTEFVESSATNLYFGNDSVNAYQLEYGTQDSTTNYSWYVETGAIFPSGSELNKVFEGVEVIANRGFGTSVQYKIVGDEKGSDDPQWKSIGQLTNNLSSLSISDSPKGRGIRFRFSREPITEPIILEKINIYYKVIGNPFI